MIDCTQLNGVNQYYLRADSIDRIPAKTFAFASACVLTLAIKLGKELTTVMYYLLTLTPISIVPTLLKPKRKKISMIVNTYLRLRLMIDKILPVVHRFLLIVKN